MNKQELLARRDYFNLVHGVTPAHAGSKYLAIQLSIPASVLCLIGFWSLTFGASDPLAGHWEGIAFKDRERLQFVLNFRTDAETVRGTISVDTMGALELPLANIRYRSRDIHFEITETSASSTFDGKVEDGKISGTWQFLGVTGTFFLNRTAKPLLHKKEEEVRFRNGDVSLAGTLILPLSSGPHPAIVFTHGSGPVSRDALRFMADFFSRHGIAGLIYDKRGVGASTGDWRRSSLDDLAGDALAGVQLLKSRSDINPKQIGLWGLSQPGWINPLAASRSKDVAFVIVVSGACTTPEYQEVKRVELTLRADGFSEDEIGEAVELMKLKFNFARTGTGWEEYKAALERAENKPWFDRGGKESGFVAAPDSKESWSWRFWGQVNKFDPIPVWKNVKCPVLAVYGESDTITPVPESVRNLQKGLKEGGNNDYTIRVFPQADHGIYVWPRPGELWHWPHFADGYLELMVNWLLQRVDAGHGASNVPFAITPAQPLMDDRVSIKIAGLPPNQTITIRAVSRAQDQRYWRSAATFTSAADGSIDLSKQTPISGTYEQADGMGLFWSMRPDSEPNLHMPVANAWLCNDGQRYGQKSRIGRSCVALDSVCRGCSDGRDAMD